MPRFDVLQCWTRFRANGSAYAFSKLARPSLMAGTSLLRAIRIKVLGGIPPRICSLSGVSSGSKNDPNLLSKFYLSPTVLLSELSYSVFQAKRQELCHCSEIGGEHFAPAEPSAFYECGTLSSAQSGFGTGTDNFHRTVIGLSPDQD